MQSYFYDGQIRRFITQFIRIVSNFQVEFGKDREGNRALQRVPVFYGDQSRQAAQILRGNSENALPTVPAMAVYVSGYDYDRERVQEPFFVSKMNIRERRYDPSTGNYDTQQSDAFTVERLMPVPYKLTLKLDIWTSNTEQKLQLIEQLSTLFNPGLEIQSTDNYVDWTSLTTVFLTGINWDSRTIPMNTDESISIATMTFELPVWISGPAKVKKLGVINKIITSIYDNSGNLSQDLIDGSELVARKIVTPFGYDLLYSENTLTLLKKNDVVVNNEKIGSKDIWRNLVNFYGNLQNGISEVRLQIAGTDSEMIGTVAYHPTDDSKLLFTSFIDTMPANTVNPVNAIIDPFNVDINALNLLTPAAGTRYLILNPIGSFDNSEAAVVWGGVNGAAFVANANDIIEYTGTHWVVSFDNQSEVQVQYVTNLNTNTQYKFLDQAWTKSVEGLYREGEWSLVL